MKATNSQDIIAHLSRDPVMKNLIEKYGFIELGQISSSLYIDIVERIINQQLSVKAAETIYSRFQSLFPGNKIEASTIIKLPDDQIRKAGISYSKIRYIKGLSESILNKSLRLEDLSDLSDEEVSKRLTSIKGIGSWTAEMILIFSLRRPDIFSVGDVGIQNAMSKLYKIDKKDLSRMLKLSRHWKPYRTYASCYLWKSLG